MLDPGADFGFDRGGAPRRLRHRAARWLFAMDAADEAILLQELLIRLRAIGRVNSDDARRVVRVEQPFAQPRPLVGRGVRGVPAADRPLLAVNRDMVPIAEHRGGDVDGRNGAVPLRLGFAELDCPARVAVLVAEFAGLVFQSSGTPPSLIAFFSFSMSRCSGAAISEASTIWPPIAI
jgi:hypothetical protein